MQYLTGKIINPEKFNLDNFIKSSQFMDNYQEILRVGMLRFVAYRDRTYKDKLVLQFSGYECQETADVELYEIMTVQEVVNSKRMFITYALYVPK